MNKWKKKDSEVLVDSKWVKVMKDTVELPDKKTTEDFYVVDVQDAAAVVALDISGDILLKKEYRYCYDKELIELPAGAVEPGDKDTLETAKRELKEETGFISDDWTYLGPAIESPSRLTNYIHIYLAKKCRKAFEQSLDHTEDISVLKVSFETAIQMVMDNDICCSSSSYGILRAARMMGY